MSDKKTAGSRSNLTQEEVKWINDKINEKGLLDPPCEFCGEKQFMTQSSLVHPFPLIITDEGKYQTPLGGSIFPTIPVICLSCGNTKFFNVLVLGFEPEELRGAKDE